MLRILRNKSKRRSQCRRELCSCYTCQFVLHAPYCLCNFFKFHVQFFFTWKNTHLNVGVETTRCWPFEIGRLNDDMLQFIPSIGSAGEDTVRVLCEVISGYHASCIFDKQFLKTFPCAHWYSLQNASVNSALPGNLSPLPAPWGVAFVFKCWPHVDDYIDRLFELLTWFLTVYWSQSTLCRQNFDKKKVCVQSEWHLRVRHRGIVTEGNDH